MQRMSVASAAVLGILLAVGIYVGGLQLKHAVVVWKQADRVVSVKGLAEREVPVDLVLWPLNFEVGAPTLDELHTNLGETQQKVRNFLLRHGFDEAEISVTPPEVTDQWAGYIGERRPETRYRASAVLLVRTDNVALVQSTMPQTDELVKEDVVLSRSWEHQTQYIFTDLNAIKPEMIAEATKEARRAADQFAEDSGSRVGKIRSAQQGYFTIEDVDRYTPHVKRVRVVTTIEYLLED